LPVIKTSNQLLEKVVVAIWGRAATQGQHKGRVTHGLGRTFYGNAKKSDTASIT